MNVKSGLPFLSCTAAEHEGQACGQPSLLTVALSLTEAIQQYSACPEWVQCTTDRSDMLLSELPCPY